MRRKENTSLEVYEQKAMDRAIMKIDKPIGLKYLNRIFAAQCKCAFSLSQPQQLAFFTINSKQREMI